MMNASIYEGHSHQNGLFTLFGIEKIEKMSYYLIRNSKIQSTLVISNSLISNNRLSRSENLVPV